MKQMKPMKRAHLSLLAVVLFAAACNPSQPRAAKPQAPDAGAQLDVADSKQLLAEVDRLKDTIKDKPKTFEVLAALGNLYYENGRYLDAVDTYRQAEELSAPAEAERERLVKQGVKPAAELPSECRRSGSDYGLAQILDAAKKMDPPRALRCLDGVLEQALAVRSRRGNAFYLIGNPDAALQEHRRVLAVSPDYPESLFFVGAIVLEQSQGDKKQLEEGKKLWRRLLEVAPDHPRAELVRATLPKADEVFAKKQEGMPAGHPPVAASDNSQLPPGHPQIGGQDQPSPGQRPMAHSGPTPEEMQNMAEAVQNTERTPELEKGLDELLAQSETALDKGDYQAARDAAVRVMPMRPGDARAAADLGGAMRGLGRTDMAQRTLQRALQIDPKQPRALYEMARLQEAQNDKAGAMQSYQALLAADPKFAQAHGVQQQLAKLK
jgi:tetratricopeptide (TPR) repeat protein